jgi:hypothetical protein
VTTRAPTQPAAPTLTLPDLARVAAEAIEHACQAQRDAAREVMDRRLVAARAAAGLLSIDRGVASVACLDLAARLPEGSRDRTEVEAIAAACRGGYAAPEMGLRLHRIAASAPDEERTTLPPEAIAEDEEATRGR